MRKPSEGVRLNIFLFLNTAVSELTVDYEIKDSASMAPIFPYMNQIEDFALIRETTGQSGKNHILTYFTQCGLLKIATVIKTLQY